MNRLQIVQKYMSLNMRAHNRAQYDRAQRLHQRIIKLQDMKIANLVIESDSER